MSSNNVVKSVNKRNVPTLNLNLMAKKNKKFVSNEAIHHSNSAASLLIKPPQVTKNPKKVNNVKRQQNCVQFKPNAMAN